MDDFGVNILHRSKELALILPNTNKEYVLPYTLEKRQETLNFDDNDVILPSAMIQRARISKSALPSF